VVKTLGTDDRATLARLLKVLTLAAEDTPPSRR
jgi:hypothetical protein